MFFSAAFISCLVIRLSLKSNSFCCSSLMAAWISGPVQDFAKLFMPPCSDLLFCKSFPPWSGWSLHNGFVTSYKPFRFRFFTAASASLASPFSHSLLSALKHLFTSLFFSLNSAVLISCMLCDLVSSTFFSCLVSSILLQVFAVIQVLPFLCL